MTSRDHDIVCVYGAGGHARVCVDVLREDPAATIEAIVTDDGDGRHDLGVEVGPAAELLRDLTESGIDATFCVAIGDNGLRQAVSLNLTQSGHRLTRLISRHAVVADSVRLGAGVQILPGAIVMAASEIGDGVIVNTNASVDHDARLGAFVHVAPGAVLAGAVSVGERTLVGVGARLLPGVSVGADVTIGAGAVVLHDVADGATVVGNPARPLTRRPEERR